MNRRERWLSLGIALGLLAGCGSSSGTHGNPPPTPDAGVDGGPEALTAFCTNVVTAIANVSSRCQGGPAAQWQTLIGNQIPCAAIEADVDAGRISYSSSEAGQCVAATANTVCSAYDPMMSLTSCLSTFSGNVAVGAACTFDLECPSGDYCLIPTNTCGGTCAIPTVGGAACTPGTQCISGYVCSQGTCVQLPPAPTPAAEDQSCGYDASTGMTVPCGLGYACDAQFNICVPVVREGSTCTAGHHVCELFTACGSDGKCDLDPTAAGQACGEVPGQDPIGCIGSLYCLSPDGGSLGACQNRLGGGGACSNDDECTTYNCQLPLDGGLSGTCTAPCPN